MFSKSILRMAVSAMTLSAVFSTMAYTTVERVLENSEVYPGTVHTYCITIPDGYDGTKPACLYLGLDGIFCNAPEHIDSLIASGDMPMTIGVHLQPGIIRDKAGNVVRYNRSNEFDATDDRFATFLETEVLPDVCATALPDGRRIVLTDNPFGRCIAGLSSGGIAAFNAAWQRPDLFGRVYSGCGTFVPMRGGNDLEAIVRKHEPKALKIFLQDGYSDTWNPTFGSWYEHNRLLASALEFAGYDCAFDWAEGGHSPERTSRIFPLVLKWLWNGYDTNNFGIYHPTNNDTLAPLMKGYRWGMMRKPVDVSASMDSLIYYPDRSFAAIREVSDGHIDQCVIGENGEQLYRQRFYWPHSYNNNNLNLGGMAFDANGLLWAVTDSGIQIFDQNGRVRGILELPVEVKKEHDIARWGIVITDGTIILSDGTVSFTRRYNVTAPTPGVRPPSQGQG